MQPITQSTSAALPLQGVGERPRRVLILDDNADAAYVLHQLLQFLGYDVISFLSPHDALACIEAFNPDACISDLNMPMMNGYAFARALRANPRFGKLLLIAHSGYDSAEHRKAAFDAGFDKYLSKSVGAEIIVQSLGPCTFSPSTK
jgi:CheY-like chemotaxis protein